MSYNMKKLVEQVGFGDFSDLDEDEGKIYERMKHGRCMTCEKPLGKDANVIVTRVGIVGAYCSGVCHSDMAVMGYLQETFDDITEKVALRNLAMPQHDETPDDETPDDD